MEASIQEQILSLEELSNDLITANIENLDIEDDSTKDVFEDLVLTKLQNIRNLLESTDDKTLDMMDDLEIGGEEYSNESIEQLLDTIKSDVMSLDYQNGTVLNVEKDKIHLPSLL